MQTIHFNSQQPQSVHKTRQQGFTLIEVMIALVIGIVLITGMIAVFLGNKRTAALTEAMTEMQQSARFALDTLARDARMSGFQGCIDVQEGSAKTLADNSPTENLSETAIGGSTVISATSWLPEPPTGFVLPSGDITPVTGSHVLSLQFGSQETFQLVPMDNASEPIVLTNANSGFKSGDLAIISNCQVADLIEISAALGASLQHDESVNSGTSELSAAYGTGGEKNRPRVMEFFANSYFLADTDRTNKRGETIRSLFRQSIPYTSDPVEVVEGVELFRVRFGLRDDTTPNIDYVTADDLNGREAQIVSVQVGLLMQSYHHVLDTNDSNFYNLAGSAIAPGGNNPTSHAGDRRLRMAFNSTINIRNRE